MIASNLVESDPLPVALVSTAEKNARTQEFVRAGITFSFLLILVLIIIWGCIESRSWKTHWDQTKELLQIILPALTGLLGSSLGFYFGRTATSSSDSSASQTTPQ